MHYINRRTQRRSSQTLAVIVIVGCIIAAVTALTGCGGSSASATPTHHGIDRQALVNDLHQHGYPNATTDNVKKSIAATKQGECGQDVDQLELTAGAMLDNDVSLPTTRLLIKHVCPDTLKNWDRAVAKVNALT